MKPFHFYLFLLFACWLQPQVLPAQDNRLAEHPFNQDSWYRADSMKYFYLHAHKLRPIHRGAGGIYGNFEERMLFELIYSLKFGEWQDSIYAESATSKSPMSIRRSSKWNSATSSSRKRLAQQS